MQQNMYLYMVYMHLPEHAHAYNMYMHMYIRDHRGRDHMVVGFTTTCAISTNKSCEFEPVNVSIFIENN